MNDQGVILRTSLCHKDFCHSFAVPRIGSDAVDRLGRQSHQFTVPQKVCRFRDTLRLGR